MGDEETREKKVKLDSCYVIKSYLPPEVDKQMIHEQYEDLAAVEQACGTRKSRSLETKLRFAPCKKVPEGIRYNKQMVNI